MTKLRLLEKEGIFLLRVPRKRFYDLQIFLMKNLDLPAVEEDEKGEEPERDEG